MDFSSDAFKGALKSMTVYLALAVGILPDLLSQPDVQAAINSLVGITVGPLIVTKVLAAALLINRFRTAKALADKVSQ